MLFIKTGGACWISPMAQFSNSDLEQLWNFTELGSSFSEPQCPHLVNRDNNSTSLLSCWMIKWDKACKALGTIFGMWDTSRRWCYPHHQQTCLKLFHDLPHPPCLPQESFPDSLWVSFSHFSNTVGMSIVLFENKSCMNVTYASN